MLYTCSMAVVNSTTTTCLKSTLCILGVIVFFIAVLSYFSSRSLSVEIYTPNHETIYTPSRYEGQGSTSEDDNRPSNSTASYDGQIIKSDDPHNINTHTQYNPMSYVAVFTYGVQLGSAMRRFVQLLSLAARWKRPLVDPFALGSISALGIPDKANLRDSIYLSHFYNLSHLEDCEDITISSFEKFLVNSTRELVWLNFVKGKKSRDPSIYDCTGDHKAIGTLNLYLESIKEKAIAKHGKNYKFKLVKAVCVEAAYSGFSLDDLEKAVAVTAGSEHVRTSTLVIPSWIGLTNRPGVYLFYTKSKSDINWSMDNDALCNVDTLPRTPLILNASDEFMKSLNLSGPFIGVHFRIELLRYNQWQNNPDQCVEKFGDVIQVVMKKHNVTSESVIAINDIRDYGTVSNCAGAPRSKCIDLRNKIVKRLESWGIRTVKYDPTLFNTLHHRTFVSLVEKETLSSANYFIGVGGGNYQAGIEHLFAKKHGGKDGMYWLCTAWGAGPDRLPDPAKLESG